MSSRKWKPLMYTCGKCHHAVSEGAVNAHLAKCQPKGAECGKCRKLITDPDFVGHYKACVGRPKEAVEVASKERDIDMKPNPNDFLRPQRWAETPEPCLFNGRITCHINKDDRHCDGCWAKPKEEPKDCADCSKGINDPCPDDCPHLKPAINEAAKG